MNYGELIYTANDKVMAWVGSKDVDSDCFKISEITTDCLFVILGHELVKPAELYAVSLRIRRNIIDASYDIDAGRLVIEEYYYSTRKIHEYHFKNNTLPTKVRFWNLVRFLYWEHEWYHWRSYLLSFDSENNKFITLRDTLY